MELSVWTRRLAVKRELWHLGDIVPGFPIPVQESVAALGVAFLEWWVLIKHLHLSLPLPPPLPLFLFCSLPAAAWYLAGRPAVEGKPVHVYLWSQLRYFLAEPRTLVHVEPAWEPQQLRLREVLFEPRQDA
jgi:hypothetical protein